MRKPFQVNERQAYKTFTDFESPISPRVRLEYKEENQPARQRQQPGSIQDRRERTSGVPVMQRRHEAPLTASSV